MLWNLVQKVKNSKARLLSREQQQSGNKSLLYKLLHLKKSIFPVILKSFERFEILVILRFCNSQSWWMWNLGLCSLNFPPALSSCQVRIGSASPTILILLLLFMIPADPSKDPGGPTLLQWRWTMCLKNVKLVEWRADSHGSIIIWEGVVLLPFVW